MIYIDNFGNVVTNVRKKDFQNIAKGRKFEIKARSNVFKKIHDTYSGVVDFTVAKEGRNIEDGRQLALFNSSDFLELAIYKSNPLTVGGAASLFGLKLRDTITINFEK